MTNTIIDCVLHHCPDCAHTQEGTHDWGIGTWTCKVCGYVVTFTTDSKVTA